MELFLYRGATLTAAQFSQVSATTSITDIDVAATAVSGGLLVFALTVAKTGDISEDLTSLDIVLESGETLTIAARSANNSDVTVSFAWVED